MQPAEGDAHALDRFRPGGIDAVRPHILVNDAKKLQHVAFDEVDLTVHVGFGNCQRRIQKDSALRLMAFDDDVDRSTASVAEGLDRSVRVGDREIAGSDQPPDNTL